MAQTALLAKDAVVDLSAHKIIEHHEAGLKYLNLSVHHFAEAGRLLAEQKAKLKHGEWSLWIHTNLPFGHSTAANYMRIYTNYSKLQRVANLQDKPLSLRQCLKIIGRPKEDEEEKAHRRNPAWLKRFMGGYAVGVSNSSIVQNMQTYRFMEKIEGVAVRIKFRSTYKKHVDAVCFSCQLPNGSVSEDRVIRIRDVLWAICTNNPIICIECRRFLWP